MSQDTKSNKPKIWVSDRTIANRYEIARSTVWAWSRNGKLPKPVKLGDNITRWNDEEVTCFLSELAAAREEFKRQQ